MPVATVFTLAVEVSILNVDQGQGIVVHTDLYAPNIKHQNHYFDIKRAGRVKTVGAADGVIGKLLANLKDARLGLLDMPSSCCECHLRLLDF